MWTDADFRKTMRPLSEILATLWPWMSSAQSPNGRLFRENFADWFEGSQVVGIAGQPLVVFHGTTAGTFDQFKPVVQPRRAFGFGIHFAENHDYARRYALDKSVAKPGKAPVVYMVALQATRPMIADRVVKRGEPDFGLAEAILGKRLSTMTTKDTAGVECVSLQSVIAAASPKRAQQVIEAAGYDAVRFRSFVAGAKPTRGPAPMNSSTSWIVFSPEQVKSLEDNSGLFLRGPSMTDNLKGQALQDELREQMSVLTTRMKARAKADRQRGFEQLSDGALKLNLQDSLRVSTISAALQELIHPKPKGVVERTLADEEWYSDATAKQQSILEQFPQSSGGLNGLAYRQPSEDLHEAAQAHFNDYETVPGIREVPLSALGELLPGYDTPHERQRIRALADAIEFSGEIEPIFVGLDPSGVAYVMEGQHRVRALILLGHVSVPARVIVDFDQPAEEDQPRERE